MGEILISKTAEGFKHFNYIVYDSFLFEITVQFIELFYDLNKY